MRKIVVLCTLLILSASAMLAQKVYSLASPDGVLRVDVKIGENISYSVFSGTDLVLKDATLGMQLADGWLGHNPRLKNAKRSVVNETIRREVPLKNAFVKNHCNVLTLNMNGGYGVEFRAYDDGVAYRFVLAKKGEVEVIHEDYTLIFPEAFQAHISKTPGFKTSYEYPYTHISTAEYKEDDEMTYFPVLFETPAGDKVLVSEANLCDYPAMFLKSTGNNGVRAVFPKVPLAFGDDGDRSVKITQEADYIAKTSGSRTFPWRFLVISKDDRKLVENEMVFKLSDPCELIDASWVKPGQVSWDWWNHWNVTGVDFKAGINTATYKYYIDFASKYGIPYIIMDEGWSKSTREPFEANPELDLPEVIRYGKEKNVSVVLWLTWLTVENNFSLFEEYEKWGIAGVKIDFMDRSDQWMVNFYERAVKEAAKHHLFVDFHGAFKPAGLERRYPNLLSYEGVLGLEQGPRCLPSNSIYLPFMRGAVGPMDFTPGSMFSAQPEDNRSSRSNAMGSGTRAYQMALYVVFESGVQMLADTPTLYLQEDECTRFISSVPTVWDELKVLDAKVGEYVVLARRTGNKWFVGAITTDKSQQLTLDLSFLSGNGNRQMTSFEDGINADRFARDYKKRTFTVNKDTKLAINLVRNGGWCAVIE